MDAQAFQAGLNWRNQREAKAEAAKKESAEAQSLRKLMAIYEPDRKDQFTTMSLADLRGESLAYAGKATAAKERQETMKAQRDEQSAQSMQALVAALGQTTPTRFPSTTMPGVFPDAVAGTRPPVTAARVRELLPQHPGAANSGNLVDLMRALQSGEATDETGGDPRITEGPFGTKLVSDFRGRGTPQVVRPEKENTKFIVEPIMDKFGRAAGYGVKAQFGSEAEAKAWAEQQNQTFGGGAGGATKAPEPPKDPKDREKGKLYQTPRGVLKWTGTGWMTP